MKLTRGLMLAFAFGAISVANADLLFDRGLPEANLNNAAGSNRSNVAWAEDYTVGMLGDDFTLAGAGTYKVNTVRLWVIGTEDSVFGGYPMQLSAWSASKGIGGWAAANVSGTFVSSVSSYGNGDTYQGSSGSMIKLWQVDFAFDDYFVNGGDTQLFFLNGQYLDGKYKGITPFMHASNKDLSGSLMEGADDSMYELYFQSASAGVPYIEKWDSNHPGIWDKTSDFNIQVMGERAVPGPAAIIPFAVGLLAAARRRRK